MIHDRLIVIQSLTTSRDSYGQPVQTWTDSVTVWAKRIQATGREYWRARTVNAENDTVFELRPGYRPTPESNRIVYDGETYDISSVVEIGRGRGWEVRAKAQVDE